METAVDGRVIIIIGCRTGICAVYTRTVYIKCTSYTYVWFNDRRFGWSRFHNNMYIIYYIVSRRDVKHAAINGLNGKKLIYTENEGDTMISQPQKYGQ